MSFIPMDGDEVRKMMDRARDHQMMASEAAMQDVKHLFMSLEPEQLKTIRMIFSSIARISDDPISSFYEGVTTAILFGVHGRCAGCGEDHAEELLNCSDPTGETE